MLPFLLGHLSDAWMCICQFRCVVPSGHSLFGMVQRIANLNLYSELWVDSNTLFLVNSVWLSTLLDPCCVVVFYISSLRKFHNYYCSLMFLWAYACDLRCLGMVRTIFIKTSRVFARLVQGHVFLFNGCVMSRPGLNWIHRSSCLVIYNLTYLSFFFFLAIMCAALAPLRLFVRFRW